MQSLVLVLLAAAVALVKPFVTRSVLQRQQTFCSGART